MLQSEELTTPTLHRPLHSKVSNYLNNQRQTGQYCDILFELEASENAAFAHYCVVGAQSEFIGGSYFMQQSLQFSIHNPLKVTIPNFSCEQCLQTLLDFFYEDVVSVPTEHLTHIIKLAKMLAVTELLNLFNVQRTDSDISEQEAICIAADVEGTSRGAVLSAIDSSNEQNNISLTSDNIFKSAPNYFKLENPRANNSSDKTNYCIGCDFKCYRVQNMIEHMSNCGPAHLTCSLCEVGFICWRDYDAHLKKHSSDLKKPFFCLECPMRFMARNALLAHRPKHSAATPYLCPHCGKGFKWKHGLSNHLLIHSQEKQMLCDVCGYSTTHMKALKSHKLQHTGELLKCTYPGCTHTSNRKENMKLHIETHKQEQPFVCEVCGCKFSQNKNLKRHALKHSTEDIKKYKCHLCSFCSHRSDKLKEHMQGVHTEKALQLELPEIVDTAFEKTIKDDFSLPLLVNRTASESATTNTAPINKRRRKPKDTLRIKRLMPIAPKPQVPAVTDIGDLPI